MSQYKIVFRGNCLLRSIFEEWYGSMKEDSKGYLREQKKDVPNLYFEELRETFLVQFKRLKGYPPIIDNS